MFNRMSNCCRIGLVIALVIGISMAPVSGVRVSYLFESDGMQYADIHFDYRVPVTFIAGNIEHDVPNASRYISNVNTFEIIATDKEAEVYEEWMDEKRDFSQFTFLGIDNPFELSLSADYIEQSQNWKTNVTFYSITNEVFTIQSWNIYEDVYNLTSDSSGHIAIYCDCFYRINIIDLRAINTASFSWTLLIFPLIAILWRREYV